MSNNVLLPPTSRAGEVRSSEQKRATLQQRTTMSGVEFLCRHEVEAMAERRPDVAASTNFSTKVDPDEVNALAQLMTWKTAVVNTDAAQLINEAGTKVVAVSDLTGSVKNNNGLEREKLKVSVVKMNLIQTHY